MRSGQLLCILLVFSCALECESKSWILRIAQKVATKIKGKPPCGTTCIKTLNGGKKIGQEAVQETAQETAKIIPQVDDVLKPAIVKGINVKGVNPAKKVSWADDVVDSKNVVNKANPVKDGGSLASNSKGIVNKATDVKPKVEPELFPNGLIQPSIVKKVNPKVILKDDTLAKEIDKVVASIPKPVLKPHDYASITKFKDPVARYNFLRAQQVPQKINPKTILKVDDVVDSKVVSGSKIDVVNKVNPAKDVNLASNSKVVVSNKAYSVPNSKLDSVVDSKVVSYSNIGAIKKIDPVDKPNLASIFQQSPVKKLNPKNILKNDEVLAKPIEAPKVYKPYIDPNYKPVSAFDDSVSRYNALRAQRLPQNPAVARVKAQQANLDSKVNIARPKEVLKTQNTKINGKNVNQPKQTNAGPKQTNAGPKQTNAGPEQPQSVRGIAYADDVVVKGKDISKKVGSQNANQQDAVQQADQAIPKYSDMRNSGTGPNSPSVNAGDYANKNNVLLTSGVKVATSTTPWITKSIYTLGNQLKECLKGAMPWVVSFGALLGSFTLFLCCCWCKQRCCCSNSKQAENVNAGKLEITLKGLPAESSVAGIKKDTLIPIPKTLIRKERKALPRAGSLNQLAEFYSSYTVDRPAKPKCLIRSQSTEFMI